MLLNWEGGHPSKWSGRRLKPELLECAGPADAARNLRELASINRWFGGHRALLRMMRDLVHPNERFSVLDVGAGSGDMARCLIRRYSNATVVAADHRSFHLQNAPGVRVVADAFQLPFRKHAFDFVLCSSVLHHFPDSEAIEMISTLRQFARRALLLLDLERHPIAYRFLPITRRILGWGPLTVHDGPASVAAAFRLEELVALTQAAGAGIAIGRRHRPWFRVSVVVPSGMAESSGPGIGAGHALLPGITNSHALSLSPGIASRCAGINQPPAG
jgi:2-polyprenyl-3-methyl-5-hydroxy-6-metoxy-1,4-benzoquinol methylase